ncbi:hypothetical protein [Methyloversatilis sp.]|uniref:hypothetical protein n=1 Tax=Methyloversatilis sp. TaxID=2569862 RepID=UPI0035B10B99
MLTLEQYWMKRDKAYASDLTDEIRENAAETVRRANLLLEKFYADRPNAVKRKVNSGWRPPAVNQKTKNAAPKSNHMLARAVDIGDQDGELDKWLMTVSGQNALEEIGLWMEHPSATPGWAHVQIVPPRSGKRVFYP